MSKPDKYGKRFDIDDTLATLLENGSKVALWGGLVALAIGVGFLIATYSAFAQSTPPASIDQAMSNIGILQKMAIIGAICSIVGSTYIFWGEETLAIFQLALSAALWFSPLYVPGLVASGYSNSPTQVGANALAAIQMAGTTMGALSIMVLVAAIAARVKDRAREGARADQMKYGKGIKEEKEINNVFMGKCWQLPFCRKFVRERCPIYHAKRTCWRERVGCMCEEQVIRDAMENKAIPKDMLTAAKYIPYNNKLTLDMKKERCRQCVIYNEHQKHKYKLCLPLVIAGFVGIYVLLRTPLLQATGGMVDNLDRIFANLTYTKGGGGVTKKIEESSLPFNEILLVCAMIVVLTYALKVLEHLIFKLKI